VTARLLIGDVFARLAEIPDASVDLVVTSPPFLALRSYLPADHPDKALEIGSEATPADFLDTLLALTAEWGRVLAPHGSICVELGDTYSGPGGFSSMPYENKVKNRASFRGRDKKTGAAWPLAKSLTGIPTLYPWCLAYARNLLTGVESPAGQWRIRNLIVWGRSNPPVGALADKFRPATSYITVACRGRDRWFDLDAVRTPTGREPSLRPVGEGSAAACRPSGGDLGNADKLRPVDNPAGAPPLDWHADDHPEDGDWLWRLPTQPYKGAHYAAFPETLPRRLIQAMCPLEVCTRCGEPRRRVTGEPEYVRTDTDRVPARLTKLDGERPAEGVNQHTRMDGANTSVVRRAPTLGWTTCGCADPTYRPGVVLDPFAGSGTTLAAAIGVGRDAIGIDLDERNADLVRERCGMFLEVAS
jgi:DNA modification methylase